MPRGRNTNERGRAADRLLPDALEGHGRHATDGFRHALAISVVGVGFGHTASRHAGGQVVRIPGERAPAAAQQVAIRVVAVGRAATVARLVRAAVGRAVEVVVNTDRQAIDLQLRPPVSYITATLPELRLLAMFPG